MPRSTRLVHTLDPLPLAKGRMARRARERGAVMFIVAMTLSIIAAMGMYALNVAATEVKTAGYVRQQSQSYYLSEYGVFASTQEVAGPKAQMYRDLMLKTPDTNCTSLYGIPPGSGTLPQACRRVGAKELASQWSPPATLIAPYVSNADADSRGSVGIPAFPDFYVELTDPAQKAPPSGYGMDQGLCFIQFTVAAVGIIPTAVGADITEGLQSSRARIVGGPIKCF